MKDIGKYDLLALNTLHELKTIVDLITEHLTARDLAKKIDIFFYIYQNRRAKMIYADMKAGVSEISELYNDLCRVELSVKARWQSDFRFIATPVSLHEYFG